MKSFYKYLALFLIAAGLRCGAAWGKAKEKDPHAELGAKALGMIYSAMVSDDPDVRVLAAEQWGPINNPAAVSVLRRALKDESSYVRIAAAGSLFQLGDASGLSVLEGIATAAPKEPEKGTMAGALQQMQAIARNKIRVVAIRTIAFMGKTSSVDTLKRTLADKDGAVRDAGAMALARLGDDTQLAQFVEALSSDDPQIRAKAAHALGEIGTPAVLNYLKPMASDSNYQVRAAVMESLGATGSVLALPELSSGINDENELVRSKAVASLGRIDSPSAVSFLESARASASNAYMELLAIAGLARLGQKVDIGVVQRALSQPDEDTRLLAVEVLETVGASVPSSRDAALENLDLTLDDKALRIRVRAAAALVKILQQKGEKGQHD